MVYQNENTHLQRVYQIMRESVQEFYKKFQTLKTNVCMLPSPGSFSVQEPDTAPGLEPSIYGVSVNSTVLANSCCPIFTRNLAVLWPRYFLSL